MEQHLQSTEKPEPFYIPILQYLGYDMQITQKRLEENCGFKGDMDFQELKHMVKQAETHPQLNFQGNLFFLSDRLYGVADGLHYFMLKRSGASISVAFDAQEVLAAYDSLKPDYLIIVGYLQNKSSYDVIPMLREKKRPPHIVMYARPDGLIEDICRKHRITHIFDRFSPVGEFVTFLNAISK